jgi:hypothetical protein
MGNITPGDVAFGFAFIIVVCVLLKIAVRAKQNATGK